MDVRENLALAVCDATQKTNYKCEFNCEKKGKCAYCLIMAEQMIANGVTVQPVKIGDTVYGQFDWYGKEIHECEVVKVKVCQFRDKSFHCFLDVEFDITDPYYRDGRVMRCMQQATYGENYGTWHRVYASREEAENAMPQPPKGE